MARAGIRTSRCCCRLSRVEYLLHSAYHHVTFSHGPWVISNAPIPIEWRLLRRQVIRTVLRSALCVHSTTRKYWRVSAATRAQHDGGNTNHSGKRKYSSYPHGSKGSCLGFRALSSFFFTARWTFYHRTGCCCPRKDPERGVRITSNP
jgi:hypothetical protein